MPISTSSTKDDIPARTAYRDWAAVYDSNDNKTRDLDAACLIAADLPLFGAAVVEFGAGTGKNTAHLAPRAAAITAIDLSPDMLARARERGLGDHVRFIEHDISAAWPVEAASADFVIGNLVLEHVRELEPVLTHAGRALRTGGTLYLSELHPFRQLRGSQAQFSRNDGSVARVEAYYHGVSDYLNAARAAGLRLVSLHEVIEDGATVSADTPPRLLVMQFVKET